MVTTAEERAAETIRLLWRHREEQPRRRGPRPRKSLDDLVEAGVQLADEKGLAGLAVRPLADALGISRMAIYSYVSDLDQLTELMIDSVHEELLSKGSRRFPYGSRSRPPVDRSTGWRRAAKVVTDANLDLVRRHPWLVERSADRPVLGPHTTAKYERELTVFDQLGLTDQEMDLALWQLLGHVRTTAVELRMIDRAEESSAQWWQAGAAAAAQRITAEEFPLAVRVGEAAAVEQQSAFDPLTSYRFGLDRLLDGLQQLIDRRTRGR